jgi:uncharacterized DUF497 family protein
MAGLRNAQQHGITAAEVWQVIGSDGRVFAPAGDARTVVYGLTEAGRYLAVLVEEDAFEDDTWDVVAARELAPAEVSELRRLRGGGDE